MAFDSNLIETGTNAEQSETAPEFRVSFVSRRPRHVYVKKAKGHSYLYYRTGERNDKGRYKHIRLPDMSDPGFADALLEAKLVRWRLRKVVLPPLPLMLAPPTGDDLYFIQCGDAVKIGRAKDVWVRLANMQANNPVELNCLCRLPNRGWEERQWHERFAHLLIRGEWYRWVPEIAKAIAKARLPYAPTD